MYKNIVISLLVGALYGCVSTKTVSLQPDAINEAKPESIISSRHEKPSFTAGTAGKAMFGLFGGIAMMRAGNRIVADHGIEDPAGYISEVLARNLSGSYRLRVHKAKGEVVTSEAISDLAATYREADLLLDVRMLNWGFFYFPTDWNNYRVIYSAKLRLIDTRTREMIAEGYCRRVPGQTDDAPSYDQLLENEAARLKEELKIAAGFCIDELRTKVLKV